MWWKKLKKKKFQFLLVGIMLMFTAAIFTACTCFVAETKQFTEAYTAVDNCPRVIVVTGQDISLEELLRNEILKKNTSGLKTSGVTSFSNTFYFKDKQIKSYDNLAYHITDVDTYMHKLKLLNGTKKSPAKGEIWISSVCASSYGIEINDKIEIGSENKVSFLVSGVVATPVSPTPYMGSVAFYINPSSIPLLEEATRTQEMNAFCFYSETLEDSKEYQDLLPESFLAEATSVIPANVINFSISYLSDIFGGVGLIAALVIFVVSLIIIRFILITNLANEYKEIGTYKALGFTEREIVLIYLKSFLFSGGIGITIGAVLSLPLAKYLCSLVVTNLGGFRLTEVSVLLVLCSIILLSFLLVCGVLLNLSKVHKISPVEAFRTGTKNSKKRAGRALIKNAYSPLSVAVNDLAAKRLSSIITLLVLTVSVYMALLFSSVNDSIQRMYDISSAWFSFPKYDAVIFISSEEEVKNYLETSSYVERYLLVNTDLTLQEISTNTALKYDRISLEIYNDVSKDALSLPLVKGRHPSAKDEILLSYNLAKDCDIKAGDWFHLKNNFYENDYLVTGLFSSMFNNGRNIIMNAEEGMKFSDTYKYNAAFVFLKSEGTYKAFEEEVKKQLPFCSVSETPPFLEGSLKSTNSISKPLTSMFVIIFSLFSLLNIVNLLIMNQIENRRQYGILKVMGFSNGYLCLKNMLKVLLLATVSVLSAVILHITLSPVLFFRVIHVKGLLSNNSLIVFVSGSLFLAVSIIAFLFTIPMRRVVPTELVEE